MPGTFNTGSTTWTGSWFEDRAERDRLNGKLAAAAAIYLLALTVAAGWYIRNRVRSGKGMA